MRSATRVLLGAFAFVLAAGTASAQNDVTFQVDMNPYITTCQFDPAVNTVNTPGSMNSWDNTQFPLADADSDGIWSGTYSLPDSLVNTTINYKFYVAGGGQLSWENDPNRSYTVTGGAQTIPVVTFNGPTPTDICNGTPQNYSLTFAVDMSVQIGRGAFDPATQGVGVTGILNGWNAPDSYVLLEDSGQGGLFAGTIDVDNVLTPGAYPFKFIIVNSDRTNIDAYESVNPAITTDVVDGNRVIRVTGTEADIDGDGRLDYLYDNDADGTTFPFFSDEDASQFLTGPATVTFNVDMRPAQYRLLDSGALPQGDGSPAGGNTAINGVSINGPVAFESQEEGGPGNTTISDWAAWGDVLNATPTRQLSDADGDGIWSITLTYAAGAKRLPVGKFGVNGADDEAGFGGNHNFPITEGTSTINLSFGCMRQADGTFVDITNGGAFTAYDEYLVPNNTATPPTCTVVRNGGATGIAGGPSIAGLEMEAFPNPVSGRATVALTLDRAMDVSVRLYDVTGREIATLAEGALGAGRTPFALDAQQLPAGVYVLRVAADGQVATRRLTVVR